MNKEIFIKKRNGNLEKFSADKINKVLQWATDDIKNVSFEEVAMNAHLSFFDKMSSGDIHTMLIEAASNLISESFIMDWKKEQYIQGCYSYPSLNENNSRDILKKSIKEKLYFAGEATNVNGHFGSIHGAMETGKEAVSEIIKDIN
jgi:hypothetical protein